MAAKDRVRWDTIYRETAAYAYPDPNPLLFQYTPSVHGIERQHRALDIAAGLGQNGLWLAAQGYVVDLMDISRVGLKRAQEKALERGLRNVNFLQVDLDEVTLEANTYDLICVFRFLDRRLFPQIRAAIRPGGRVIYETFNVRWAERIPDANRGFLLDEGELAGAFGDWNILRSLEAGYTSQLVAIKPDNCHS